MRRQTKPQTTQMHAVPTSRPEPQYRTIAEEAALRRLSAGMIRKLARQGLELPAGSANVIRLPVFKVGSAVRIPVAEADAFWALVRAGGAGA